MYNLCSKSINILIELHQMSKHLCAIVYIIFFRYSVQLLWKFLASEGSRTQKRREGEGEGGITKEEDGWKNRKVVAEEKG